MKTLQIRPAVNSFVTQILSLMLCSCLASGQAGRPLITPSGSTQTTVRTSGSVTNITTGTVRGSSAFNSFNSFNEPQGNTVNLFLPNGTTNLLNLVGSNSAIIDGTLNSILNGKIGGSIFFADPFGIIIGKNGVVNAGAFSALTPTSSFLSQFFDPTGNPSASATASVLNGTVPITANGLISVQGHVNARSSISLLGGSVVNAGSIQSGAVFSNSRPDFSDVVNVAGLQSGNAISVQNGNIEIRAIGDVENSGVIATNGANNLNAGSIDIQAGGNIKMDPDSLVSASGQGRNSNGGQIKIFADNNSELDANAVVAASGGSSGNGGSVDFSAKGTVYLKGGALNAGALNGTPGTATVDPSTIEISSTQTANDGTNVTLAADQSITVDPNATVTSQVLNGQGQSTANSGNISLTAPQITVGNGAQILANATNGFTPGDITFTANQTSTGQAASATTGINIGSATILGNNVTFQSTATATANVTDTPFSSVINNTSLSSKLAVGGAAVSAKTSNATSTIDLEGAQVTATGNLTINSTAAASTTSQLTAASTSATGTPVNATFAYGQSTSNATAKIGSGTVLTATGAANIAAISHNTLSVSAKTNQSQQGVFAGAYGSASSTSNTEVDGSVTGGSVQITATNQNSFSTSSSASDYNATQGNGGGMSLAIGEYGSTATTTLTGSAISNSGNVQIASSSTNTDNATRSSSSETSQGVKNDILNYEGKLQNLGGALASPAGLLSSSTPSASPEAGAQEGGSSMQLGLGAAISVAQTHNTAATTVSGTVTANGGNAEITSGAIDNPQISAAGSVSAGTTNFGGAVAVSDFHNTSDTYVNGSASVTGGTGVLIDANAEITDPAVATSQQLVNDFTSLQGFSGPVSGWGSTAENDVKGVVHGITTAIGGIADPGEFTTSFVDDGSSNQKGTTGGTGVGGAVNLLGLTNQSVSSVTNSANVTATHGNLQVSAEASLSAINVAGMGLGVGQLATLNPGVSAGSSIGGSYNGTNLTNTSTAYIGDGTTATASAGDVDVQATNSTFLIGVAQAGDKSSQGFGITGTFNQSNLTDSATAYIQSDATVTASNDVNVTATNPVTQVAIGGALGTGGSVQIGLGVNWNTINDTTLAYIGDPANGAASASGHVTGKDVNVQATSTEDLYAITFAATWPGNGAPPPSQSTSGETDAGTTEGAAAAAPTAAEGATGEGAEAENGAGGETFGFGISGEIALNDVKSGSNPGITTKAFINNGANVTATNGDVTVQAQDTSFAVAAGLAVSVGQEGALAGGYSQNTFNKDVEAFTGNTSLTASGLNLQAISNGSLFNVTAGGAIDTTEPGVAIAGSVNNNTITNTVSAQLGAGTVAGTPGANGTPIGSDGITVNASEGSSGDRIVSVAGGFGIAIEGGGFGAGIDMGNYTNNVSASVAGSQVNAAGNVQVTSSTNVSYLPIAVQISGGSVFGLGGAVASEHITDNTTSTVGTLSTADNLLVGSSDSSSATIVAGGLGIGGEVGLSVSAIIPQFLRTTESQIANGGNVNASGGGSAISYQNQSFTGTALDATNSGSLDDYAVAGSGSGSVAAAGAVIVNPFWQTGNTNSLQSTTEANVGPNAVVTGQSLTLHANDTSGIQDIAGMLAIGLDLGVGVGFDQAVPVWTVQTSIGSNANVNVSGSVIASSNLTNPISSYAVSGSGGAVAAEAAVTVLTDTSNTNSYIDTGATVTSNNNVALSATRSTTLTVADGGAAIGAFAGVGASIADINENNTVQAYVGSNAGVTALAQGSGVSALVGSSSGTPTTGTINGLSVTAQGTDTLTAVAAGVAGSLFVSGAGSALTNSFTENTYAQIDTGATINGTNTGAGSSQGVNLLAADTTTLTAGAGAAALSVNPFVGIGAGLGLDQENVQKNTTANIASGASVNALGGVSVDALSGETINSYTAAVAVAANGALAGASADYNTHPITPVTTASITGASVNTGSLAVDANENLQFTAITGEVSGSGDVALGAALALATANANTSASVTGGVSAATNGAVSVNSTYTSNLGATALSGSGSLGLTANAAYANLSDESSNSASLNATVPQAGAVSVTATTTRTVGATGGGLSVGALAAGGVVDQTGTSGSTTASIGGSIGQQSGETVQSVSVNANDSDTASASSSALSVGIGSGQANMASANIGGSVQGSVANAAAIKTSGDVSISATGTNDSSATVTGGNYGVVTVGYANSQASATPTVSSFIGDNENIAAGGNLNIGATYNASQVNATSTMSAGSLVNIGGGTSSAVANDSPTVSAYIGDPNGSSSTVGAANSVTLATTSNASAKSTFNGQSFGLAVSVPGDSVATSNINNSNQASVGANVGLAAGNAITVEATSTNTIPQAKVTGSSAGLGSSDSSTANACIDSPSSCSYSNAAGGTSVAVNSGSTLSAGNTATISATTSDSSTATGSGEVEGVIATNNNNANTTVVDSPSVTISSATVQAQTTSITAAVNQMLITQTSDSITSAANSYSNGTSTMNVTASPSITLNGANVTGSNALNLTADVLADSTKVDTSNTATGSIDGVTGSITATATNNTNFYPSVTTNSATKLTSASLNIQSTAPPSGGGTNYYTNVANAQNNTVVSWTLTTVQEVVDEAVGWIPFVGSLIEQVTETVTKWVETITNSSTNNVANGSFNSQPNITLNGNIYQQGSANPILVANNIGGNVSFTQDQGVTASVANNTITVNNITNNATSAIVLNAPNGTVSGSATVHRNSNWSNVSITNNSSDNLVVNAIQPASSNGSNPDLTVNAGQNSQGGSLDTFNATFVTDQTTSNVQINNNAASTVTLNGFINNPSGGVSVSNTGGEISMTSTGLIKDTTTALAATAGNIGSSSNYVNVQMEGATPAGATLSAQAGGNIFLNAQLVQDIGNTAPAIIAGPADIASVTAGGSINLNLQQPQAFVYTLSSTTPPVLVVTPTHTNGTYNVGTVTGGGNVALTSAIGPLTFNTITSTGGNVNLSSPSDVDLGVVNSEAGTTTINAPGSIFNANAPGVTDINAVSLNLTATSGSIGTSSNPLLIDSSYHGAAGTITASASGSVYLNQVADNLNLGTITSTTGDAVLTSSGSITDTNSSAASAINANNVALAAANSIGGGSGAGNTLDIDATSLTATAGQNLNITQTAGALNFTTVTATNGNATLAAASGNVNLGVINAHQGTASVAASSSIVNTLPSTATDIDAVSVNLTATNGSVGTSTTPLNIDSSYNGVAGQVSASAHGGVYLNEVAGDLNLGTVSSATSDAVLSAANGSIMDTNSGSASAITANNVTLTASNGSIGGTTPGTLEIDAASELTATAGQNVNITQTAANMNVNTVNATSGNVALKTLAGNIDLGTVTGTNGNATLLASGAILNSTPNTTATPNITAKNMNLTATGGAIGTSTTALLINNQNAATYGSNTLTTSSYGDTYIAETAGLMNVNTVNSITGNIGLTTLAGDIDLGTVTGANGNATLLASGSILNSTPNTAATPNITAKNINLTASNGGIGSSTASVFVNNQNTATSGGNTLTTSSYGDTYITESAGLMNVNTVAATNGNIGLRTISGNIDLGTVASVNGNATLLASGSILNSTPNTAATPNITAKNINLTATGGAIGTSTTALLINNQDAATSGSNTLTTSSNGDTYITETAGLMDVNTIASTNGNIGLTTLAGDIDLGTVIAKKGNLTLASSGSILNAGSGSVSNPNLVGNNMLLTATTGSIGLLTPTSTPLFVNNQNGTAVTKGIPQGSNYLDTSAYGDINITETPGNLLSHSISSTTGSIGLSVPSGSESLNTISVNNALNLSVGGSTMYIGTIMGTTGIPSVKAPSPNSISLMVGQPGGTLTVNTMSVFQSVTTQADNTYLNTVYFTNLANLNNVSASQWDAQHQAQSLQFNDTGYRGGIATNININIMPCKTGCNTTPAVIFKNYSTMNGNVTAGEDWLEFVNATVTGNAAFQNYWENFIITSKNRTPPPSWYFFLIGDKFLRNADSYEKVSPARFLRLPNHYTWVQNNTVVFPYLLSYFNLH